ncbi:addiction module toxin RelE [Stenotrophomonas sp. SPM]|uniref:type II toxin-antitoxin system HigB family toxin n=1 Tax=Stenotrophomonas sp. SPM TaxID=2170735 RepID=UPI000DE745D6|nr:type II toxin-antitoxin system HigB family toxin [Stenotrophomonas sp. SPM]PWB27421.1 addiction module toxin RelE [Stenotrophomonas sp. SPM]
MKIFSLSTLRRYWEKFPECEQALKAWHDEVRRAVWASPHDIRDRFASASFVGSTRVVFNIKGNSHCLVVDVSYQRQMVYIKFIGRHADYDRVDVSTVEGK